MSDSNYSIILLQIITFSQTVTWVVVKSNGSFVYQVLKLTKIHMQNFLGQRLNFINEVCKKEAICLRWSDKIIKELQFY